MEENRIDSVAMMLAERIKNQPAEERPGGQVRKGHLIVIDSKPPVADNTTLMLCLVKLRAVDEQEPTAYFSPEEPVREVCNRLIAIITGIDLQKIADGSLDADEWLLLDERLPLLQDAPLYIDDAPGLSMDSLKRRVTNLAKDNGVRLVVVNHLNELTNDGTPTNAHRIEANLKSIAEELGITIIAVQN